VLFQFSLLFLCELLLIVTLATERQRVEGVLRLLLMEDIVLSVPPIGEALLIRRLSDYRFVVVGRPPYFSLLGFHLEVFECVLGRRAEVHPVGVDDFGFLLQVEGFTLLDDDGILQFVLEILLIP